MKGTRILLIDDDLWLLQVMAIRLRSLGFIVDTTDDGNIACQKATDKPYDILVLDLMMPKLRGDQVCDTLRRNGILTPILVLSGHSDKYSIVKCLEIGADDFLIKPFNHDELIARIEALIRRNSRSFASLTLQKQGLELNTITGKVTYGQNTVVLTTKESLLLQRLMNDAPATVDHDALLKDVWSVKNRHTSNRLEVYISRLRTKLTTIGTGHLIQTVRGRGYYFGNPKK